MTTFIQHIVNDIDAAMLPQLHKRCYVFPTRRALVYFKDALSKRFPDDTFFMPQVYSIQDFVGQLSGQTLADDFSLVLELYRVYLQIQKNANIDYIEAELAIDKFYSFGQQIIKDFNDIDKYLAPPDKVFSTLKDIAQLSHDYNLDEELKEIIERFRLVINSDKKSELRQKFLQLWQNMLHIYNAFNNEIEKKGIAYEGKMYKSLLHKIENNQLQHQYDFYCFCGFNALTKVEERIIKHLHKQNKAILYWDADTLYLNNQQYEAGQFLRRQIKQFPPSNQSKWLISNKAHINTEKNYQFVNVPKKTGQAKWLKQTLNKGELAPVKTAIVMGDETAIFPLLYSIPKSVEKLNVTMGYPAKHSPLLALIQNIFDLHINKRNSEDTIWLKSSTLIQLLQNPFIHHLCENRQSIIDDIIEHRQRWSSLQNILQKIDNQELTNIFSIEKESKLLSQIIDLLFNIYQNYNHQQIEKSKRTLEQEIVFHYLKCLTTYQNKIENYHYEFNLKTCRKIIFEAIYNTSIPFSGEPLKGMQIMGFLESRVLDFENVIILGLNEGKIPFGKSQVSLIPFSVRKTFGLPTFEENDSIFAYHFYRLLQKANNIYLVSDAEINRDGSGERSRFILQLQSLLDKNQKTYSTQNYALKQMPPSTIEPMQIAKSARVQQKLQNFTTKAGQFGRFLSPTALTDYIKCPVEFYFKHTARLKPLNELEDEIKQLDFGNIAHKILEIIYSPYIGQTIDKQTIKSWLSDDIIAEILDKVLQEENLAESQNQLEGNNLLQSDIIYDVVKKVLKNDYKDAPFKILSLEERNLFNTQIKLNNGNQVKLGGIVDRIDEKDGITRIMDYKTGNISLASGSRKTSPQQTIDKLFEKQEEKTAFQAMFYAFIFSKKQPKKSINTGLYGLKEINKGIQFMLDGKPIEKETLQYFEQKLTELLETIFDTHLPFIQNLESKHLQYSDYKEILT